MKRVTILAAFILALVANVAVYGSSFHGPTDDPSGPGGGIRIV